MSVDITCAWDATLILNNPGNGQATQEATLSSLLFVGVGRWRQAPAWCEMHANFNGTMTTVYPTGPYPPVWPNPAVIVDPEFSAEDLGGAASLDGTVRLTGTLHFSDPYKTACPEETSFDTPNGRPNHLRQVHLRYLMAWQGNVAYQVSMAGAWTGWKDPSDYNADGNLEYATYSLSLEVSGTLDMTGTAVTPEDLACIVSFNAGNANPNPGEAGVSCGTMTLAAVIDGGECSYSWDDFNEDLVDDHCTNAANQTITCYRLKPGTDEYIAYPAHSTTLEATAYQHDTTIDCALWYTPDISPGAALAMKQTPGPTISTTDNRVGPWRYYVDEYGGNNRPTSCPYEVHEANATLDAWKRRHQEDWYGRYDYLYLQPPGETVTWTPFEVEHDSAIAVDDMVSTRSGSTVNLGAVSQFDWLAGSGVTMGVSGAYRTAATSGSPSDPRLYRDLWDDWADMEADAYAYWNSATITDTAVKAYLDARKAWYNVRRRVQAAADVCNWGNHRWLKVVGKADASRTFTLRIKWRNPGIADNWRLGELETPTSGVDHATDDSVRVITVTDATGSTDVEGLTLGTGDTTLYVDLADVAYRAGCSLAHVTGLEFRALEASATYYFKTVDLVSGASTGAGAVTEGDAAWGYWTGVPYSDDGCLVPVVDGRTACLADNINSNDESRYVLTWVNRQVYADGYATTYSPRNADETKTFDELRTLIGFQEGFSVKGAASAPAAWASYDWALFLDAGWHAATGPDPHPACTATVKCASVRIPAGFLRTWLARQTMRSRVAGIALDTATGWAAAGVHVDAEAHGDTTWVPQGTRQTADANGAWTHSQLPQTEVGLRERLLDGLAVDLPTGMPTDPTYSEHRFTATDLLDGGGDPVTATSSDVKNRHPGNVSIRGETTEQDVPGVDLHTDEQGWMCRAYAVGTAIRVQRRTLDGGTWHNLATWTGSQPALTVDPSGTLYCVYLSGSSVTRREVRAGTEATVVTGTNPSERWGPGGRLRVTTYWRSNNLYATVTDGQGNTLHGGEVTIAAAVPEQRFDVAWRNDGTIEGYYSDGVNLVQRTSTNDGKDWS